MAQFVRPISDIAIGSWTDAVLGDNDGAMWDELVADDGNRCASDPVGNNVDTTDLDVELTNSGSTDPASSINHIIRTRWNRDAPGGGGPKSLRATCELWQGVPGTGTLIASLISADDVGTTEVTGSYTLTGTEADNITDYNDLHLTIFGRGTGGGAARLLIVDLAEFEFPDAAGGLFETLTEAVGVDDSIELAQGKEVQEDVGVGDVVSRVLASERIRVEPVGVTDETDVKQGKEVVDPVGVTDETNVKRGIGVVEDVGITDTVLPAKTIRVTITEAVGVTDSTPRVHAAERVVTDPVGVQDSTPVKQSKEIVEAVGVDDSIETKLVIAQEIIEAIGVTDDINTARDLARVISEAVGVSDETPIKQSKEIVELLGITDLVVDDLTAGQLTEVLVEAIGVTDVVLAAKTIRVEITESIGVTDSTPIKQGIEVVEPVGVSDDISKAVGIEVVEDVGISDTTSRVVDAARIIVEPVGIVDVPSRILDYVRTIDEAVGLSDLVLDDLTLAGALWWRKDPVGHTKKPVAFTKVPPGSPTPW